jgi:hypothetical protein
MKLIISIKKLLILTYQVGDWIGLIPLSFVIYLKKRPGNQRIAS